MRWIVTVAAVLCAGLGAPAGAQAGPEVVELKDGHQVIGEVLAKKANALFVDLGFDILRIPRDQVVRRSAPGEASSPGPSAARTAAEDGKGFYDTSPLKPRSVKDLVQRYGEAVISIETP